MQETLYQTADAGDYLLDRECRKHSIREWMQKTIYQISVAGVSPQDSVCIFVLSIRQRMQETLYQTADKGDSLSDSGCRSLSIRQWMLETFYKTADAGVPL